MTKIEDILPLVQIIAVTALFAGISALVFVEFQASQETNQTEVNDTITFAALDTAYSLLSNNETYWVELINTTVVVSNASNTSSMVRGSNWSVDVTAGTITATTGGEIAAGGILNVSYTWIEGNVAHDAFGDGLGGLVEITGWLDLIALAVIAGAIMTIVLSSIGMIYFRGRNEGY